MELKGKGKGKVKLFKPSRYRIYGIFNNKIEKLIFISLDLEAVEMEFELEGYDPDDYSVIGFNIAVS